jgi:predicted RNA-binding Zn ribbon-like protein
MIKPDLCLDYVNTRYWRGRPTATETLNAPTDLAAWATANGGAQSTRLPARPELGRALEFREMLYRLFNTASDGKAPAAQDLQAFNEALAAAPARTRLARDKSGFSWEIEARPATALALLAPVLWSAGDLLAGPRLGRVRRCANPECGWLFLDDSRAGKRRWCSMQSCGNRAKAKRHYHRSRED